MSELDGLSPAERVEHLQQEEIARAWRGLLAQEAGRLIVWSILDMCHIYDTTYTGDAASGAFLEGERSIGLKVLNNRVFADGMGAFTAMMQEAEERLERLRIAAAKEETETDEE